MKCAGRFWVGLVAAFTLASAALAEEREPVAAAAPVSAEQEQKQPVEARSPSDTVGGASKAPAMPDDDLLSLPFVIEITNAPGCASP